MRCKKAFSVPVEKNSVQKGIVMPHGVTFQEEEHKALSAIEGQVHS